MAAPGDETINYQPVNNQQSFSTNVTTPSSQPSRTESTNNLPVSFVDETSTINTLSYQQAEASLDNYYHLVAANRIENPYDLLNYSSAYPVTNSYGANQPLYAGPLYPVNASFQTNNLMHFLPQNHFYSQEQTFWFYENPPSYQTINMPEEIIINPPQLNQFENTTLHYLHDQVLYNQQNIFIADVDQPQPSHHNQPLQEQDFSSQLIAVTPGTNSASLLDHRQAEYGIDNNMSLETSASTSRPQQSYGQNVFSENPVYGYPAYASFQASDFPHYLCPYSMYFLRQEFLRSLSRDQFESMVVEMLGENQFLAAIADHCFLYH